MCGLVGVFSSETKAVKNLDEFIRDGLLITQVRGLDATGLYQVTGQRNLHSYKKAVDATSFSSLPKTKRIIGGATEAYATIAHCRKATTGSMIDAASHPFVFDDEDGDESMAFVHNGTIDGWDRKAFETDTEFLAEQVFMGGAKALDGISGSFACIWTDMETETNNIATNGQRPLYYAYVKDKNVMLVASEAPALAWLASRNSLELQEESIYEFEKHMHYEFSLDDVRAVTKTAIEPFEAKTHSRGTWESPKDKMFRQTEELFNPPAVKPSSTVSELKSPTTPEEARELTRLVGSQVTRVCALVPCFYDEESKTGYFEVDDDESDACIKLKTVNADCIGIMRHVDQETWDMYEDYDMIYATAVGLQQPDQSSAMNTNTLVLAKPTNRQQHRAKTRVLAKKAMSIH